MQVVENSATYLPLRESERIIWSQKPDPLKHGLSMMFDIALLAAIPVFIQTNWMNANPEVFWLNYAANLALATSFFVAISAVRAKQLSYALTSERLICQRGSKQGFSIDLKAIVDASTVTNGVNVSYQRARHIRRKAYSIRAISNPEALLARLEQAIEDATGQQLNERLNGQFKEFTGVEFPIDIRSANFAQSREALLAIGKQELKRVRAESKSMR